VSWKPGKDENRINVREHDNFGDSEHDNFGDSEHDKYYVTLTDCLA
jgi:hypothetical protein